MLAQSRRTGLALYISYLDRGKSCSLSKCSCESLKYPTYIEVEGIRGCFKGMDRWERLRKFLLMEP